MVDYPMNWGPKMNSQSHMRQLAYLCLSILMVGVFVSCGKNNDVVGINRSDDIVEVSYIGTKPGLNIQVDPRMELLVVVQHFTNWADRRHTRFNFKYKNEIDSYFSQFSKHSAVQLSEQLTDRGFAFDAPATFALYHTNPPEFRQVIPFTDYLISRVNDEKRLKEFAEELRRFAIESRFMDFFNSHREFYNQIESEIVSTIGETDYIQMLESYYGDTRYSYNIIPTPLFHAGGYGPMVESAEGKNIYNICGPLSTESDKPYFGAKDYFFGILLHEFSHSFVNPLTAKYQSEINRFQPLFEPIRDQMDKLNYRNWETCVNEHLVRVNVARFTFLLKGAGAKDDLLQRELERGFIYITSLDTLMQRYENMRSTFLNYESFYPEIINFFRSLSTK